jgi:branched-chain amino acid transport system permease protein
VGWGEPVGVILAAIILTILPEVLRGVSEYRMIIYSL